jgi:hypothetical protein
VIVFYSKNVSILGEELTRDPASLTFALAAAIPSCNFGVVSWTCGCSTSGGVTSVTGSQCARGDPFMSFWSRLAAFRTLTGTSRQSRTSVLAMLNPSVAGISRLRSVKPFPTSTVLSNQAITILLHCAGITWSLATTRLAGRGPIAIPLPLKDAELGTLGPQTHHMLPGYQAPRWTPLWY